MKLVHTTRWVIAGAAIGLSAALFAGVASAATPGPTGHVGGYPETAMVATAVPAGAPVTTAITMGSTTSPNSNGASSAQESTGTDPMVSEMLASLSPKAQAEFQAIWPQMLQLMDSSNMMSGTGTAGSMMGPGLASGGHSSTS
ncbi:MAG: hypothetical protein ACYCZN_13750 [Candidatus Dormibacteria bacterium]